jgi:hypothetical protein
VQLKIKSTAASARLRRSQQTDTTALSPPSLEYWITRFRGCEIYLRPHPRAARPCARLEGWPLVRASCPSFETLAEFSIGPRGACHRARIRATRWRGSGGNLLRMRSVFFTGSFAGDDSWSVVGGPTRLGRA